MPAELWVLDEARVMGGGQHFALRLARHLLDTRGPQAVRIVCPGDSGLAAEARRAGIRVTPASFPGPAAPLGVLRAARHLRGLLRGHDALVVAGGPRSQAAAVLAGQDGCLVHLMHERDSARRPSMRLLHRRGRVLAVGANAAAAYGAPAVRNFLLEADFARLAAAAPPPGRAVLGVLARLIPEKGVAELVTELRSVPGWSRLLVAGAPQDRRYETRIRAAADERTELLGHVEDVAAFLGQVDVLMVPSVGNEAQPTVILEALAAGRPVIVRSTIASSDYDCLPVFAYGDLAAALERARAAPPGDRELVRTRFGAMQALRALEDPG